MKNAILTPIWILGMTCVLTVSCKEPNNGKSDSSETMATTPKKQTEMVEGETFNNTGEVQEEGWNNATPKDVPQVVVESLMRDYPTADISKIFVNEDGIFRLEGAFGDGSVAKLYVNGKGEWYEMDEDQNLIKKEVQ